MKSSAWGSSLHRKSKGWEDPFLDNFREARFRGLISCCEDLRFC
jgi:hypothetical protein